MQGEGKSAAAAFGIDFGTTNSTICTLLGGGDPEVIPIAQPPGGEILPYLPSYVYFAGGGRVYVGQEAKKYYTLKPQRTARSVKRDLGKVFKIAGESWTGAELATIILRHLVKECEKQMGRRLTECVLAVPSTFGHLQRELLRSALARASRSVETVHLLDEPLAAFLSHLHAGKAAPGRQGGASSGRENEKVLIVDMGGGTTDLAVLAVSRSGGRTTITPMAVWSQLNLGGDDFDAMVATELAFLRKSWGLIPFESLTPDERKFLWSSFLMVAEQLKVQIAGPDDKAEIVVPGLPGERETRMTLAASEYVRLVSPLESAFAESIKYVLARAAVSRQELGRVVLTGGMSRAWAVRRAAAEFFGLEPEVSPNPQQDVAAGACLYHASLLQPGRSDIETLRPVMTRALFLRLSGRKILRILPSSLELPTRARAVGRLTSPLVRCGVLRIPFYQADDEGRDAQPLATLTLRGKGPFKPGSPVRIEVEVDENKMISLRVGADGKDGAEGGVESSAVVWGL